MKASPDVECAARRGSKERCRLHDRLENRGQRPTGTAMWKPYTKQTEKRKSKVNRTESGVWNKETPHRIG
jgi:hypothetical protein